jgi:uncharacterized protein YciI
MVYEQWNQSDDGTLRGISYKMENGEVEVTEYLSISSRDGEIVYTAVVLGQNGGAPVDFELTRSDTVFVFENREHDFPQRIAYKYINNKSFRVEVSSRSQSGFAYTMIAQNETPSANRSKSEGAVNPNFDQALADKFGADEYGMKGYIMVILKTGPNGSDDKELIAESFAGHLKNIKRLVEEGKIIVAGPFYQHPTSGDENEKPYRGIFILDGVTDFAEAEALLESDPAVSAGFLTPDFYHWYGSAALPAYLPFSDRVGKKSP